MGGIKMAKWNFNWQEESIIKDELDKLVDTDYREKAKQLIAKRQQEELKETIEYLKIEDLEKDMRKKQTKCKHKNIDVADRSQFYKKICLDCGKEISWY